MNETRFFLLLGNAESCIRFDSVIINVGGGMIFYSLFPGKQTQNSVIPVRIPLLHGLPDDFPP